jgi:2-methylisocitrate lyase-like PEP mutase family enzyme
MTQQEKAELFHQLHRGEDVLCLLNAWDAGSARIFEAEGAPAIGTTSGGVAFAHGRADGQLSRDEMVEAIARIVSAVDIPVTADIETGFGATPEAVGETVTAVIKAGTIGVNLEDTAGEAHGALRDIEDQCNRLRTAREAANAAGVNLFVNGRTDVFWLGLADDDRLETVIERTSAYVNAGADGIFIPLLTDPTEIKQVVDAVPAPLNVLVAPSTPPIAELRRLGVKRLSTGSAPSRSTLALSRQMASDLLAQRSYDSIMHSTIPYAEVNALFGEGQ